MVAAYFNGPPNPISGLRPLIEIVMQPNMRSKRLRDGSTAYYWRPPRRVQREGLPIHFEPLGTNFVVAVKRALKLNALYGAFPAKKSRKSRKSKVGCAVLPFTARLTF
jgi:hypothetical protein